MASELIKHVSDTSFEDDVLKAGKPVLVDFWAEWCGPCKSFAPVLDEVAKEYQDRLTVAKLDIDSNRCQPCADGWGTYAPTLGSRTGVQHGTGATYQIVRLAPIQDQAVEAPARGDRARGDG